MQVIDKHQVHQTLNFKLLIEALNEGFAEKHTMPARQVFELEPGDPSHNAFAVLPAWNEQVIGVKAFTYFPENSQQGFESLYSKIMLFKRKTGEPMALVDGTSITLWRTACVSALASRYLSRSDASKLLFIGTGNLAPYMIAAHMSVRPISQVNIWGRDIKKAKELASSMQEKYSDVNFDIVDDIQSYAENADIISCATGSPTPLVYGNWLKPGCHVDLIGNHNADKRECDSEAIIRSQVFVDSQKNVLNEAGELLLPIAEGVIDKKHVKAELSELASGILPGRKKADDITLFKSVGTALSDLITANLVFKLVNESSDK